MKRGWVLLLILITLPLAGCGGKTKYYYDDPMEPERVTRMERNTSFFASENLQMHYDNEAQARAAHERVALRVSNQLIASHNATQFQTPTEETLARILLQQNLTAVNTYHGTGNAAPRTMVDQNWPAWGNVIVTGLLVGFGGGFDYDRVDSPGNSIKGDNNTFIYKSGLGNGTGSQADIYLGDYSPYDVSTAGLGASLSFDASRPYTYQPDNSRSNSETRVDSPSKSDSGLF